MFYLKQPIKNTPKIVSKVWSYVNPLNILDICDVPNPVFCLLNDNSDVNLKNIQLKVLFAAITFTKK